MKEVNYMKEKLRQLLEECMENGSENDLNALAYLLEGVQEKIKQKRDTFIGSLLHMERKIENNSYEITIPLHPVLNNNLNIIHGGITATLLDSVMGSAVYDHLPLGSSAVTNQLNIHYIAPGIGDSIRCRAEIIHKGSKTVVVSGEAYRSDGKKIAHATATFFIIPVQKS